MEVSAKGNLRVFRVLHFCENSPIRKLHATFMKTLSQNENCNHALHVGGPVASFPQSKQPRLQYLIWLRITDEVSISEVRIKTILFHVIKIRLKNSVFILVELSLWLTLTLTPKSTIPRNNRMESIKFLSPFIQNTPPFPFETADALQHLGHMDNNLHSVSSIPNALHLSNSVHFKAHSDNDVVCSFDIIISK